MRLLFLIAIGISFGYEHNAAAQGISIDTGLAILQPEDAAPQNAQKLSQRVFGGSNQNGACTYFELQQVAESAAAAAGANVLHIISKTQHSRSQPCDAVEVAFYRGSNPRQAEQSFRWNRGRKLTWDDFRGKVRNGAGDHIAAETSCGIAIETSLTGSGSLAKVYVYNTFDKQQSWVRRDFDRDDVLRHEQGHWDICELYTREMQRRFDNARIRGDHLKEDVEKIYDGVSRAYEARQELYEQQTMHGTVLSEQQRWTQMLATELE